MYSRVGLAPEEAYTILNWFQVSLPGYAAFQRAVSCLLKNELDCLSLAVSNSTMLDQLTNRRRGEHLNTWQEQDWVRGVRVNTSVLFATPSVPLDIFFRILWRPNAAVAICLWSESRTERHQQIALPLFSQTAKPVQPGGLWLICISGRRAPLFPGHALATTFNLQYYVIAELCY